MVGALSSQQVRGALLVVTAVAAERDALAAAVEAVPIDPIGPYAAFAGGGLTLISAGVGPAAAAAATATALALAAEGQYALVVSAGIGGGFSGRAALGELVEATVIVAADLGAQSPEGFLSVADLGFGSDRIEAAPLGISGARRGPILTVSTVTGTEERAAELAARGGVAEAMEGFGVAEAARQFGVAVGEVRAISNAVGLRERANWDIKGALAALAGAGRELSRLAAEVGD
jgi:futalosine hydrolase